MDANTLELYLYINKQVKHIFHYHYKLQLPCVTTESPMYYVDVSRLRTLWNCCGLVSVQQTAVIRSLHCCTIAILNHLPESW